MRYYIFFLFFSLFVVIWHAAMSQFFVTPIRIGSYWIYTCSCISRVVVGGGGLCSCWCARVRVCVCVCESLILSHLHSCTHTFAFGLIQRPRHGAAFILIKWIPCWEHGFKLSFRRDTDNEIVFFTDTNDTGSGNSVLSVALFRSSFRSAAICENPMSCLDVNDGKCVNNAYFVLPPFLNDSSWSNFFFYSVRACVQGVIVDGDGVCPSIIDTEEVEKGTQNTARHWPFPFWFRDIG